MDEHDDDWHIFDVATDFALVILIYKPFVGDGKTGHLYERHVICIQTYFWRNSYDDRQTHFSK